MPPCRIAIQVTTRASREKVEALADGSLRVWVHAPPADGEANTAVIRLLARHFDVPQSRVRIVHGTKGRKKVIAFIPKK